MLTAWFLLEIVNCNVEQDARVYIHFPAMIFTTRATTRKQFHREL